ncbi:hypothetical protein BC477_10890 [Clavibacter michiganensis subsp. michiganensis]|uniref:Uncharacterized protein n=1 Tax=Clavibacter michiganensis subsp. michiganensis TaxID=33013 RepID=A0A251XH15_CLAMM|nr:hypothetical protein BC477_10890 [Clavibacter michiganensis subsp. michiganensis]OUE02299.1 hypothetical protein CMMCAS07_09805 [Clavibacter michiganensis subsp. michiganensis]
MNAMPERGPSASCSTGSRITSTAESPSTAVRTPSTPSTPARVSPTTPMRLSTATAAGTSESVE